MNIHYKNETYLIRVVEELPEQGSKGYLYSIRKDNLGVYYRWKDNATWEKTEVASGSELTPDELDGIQNANNLNAANPVATMEDLDDIEIPDTQLTPDELEGIQGANGLNGANPAATMADIPEDLSTGLEAIDEGNNGVGWRLKGANPANYGNIGRGAIDLGSSFSPSTTVGAMGNFSTISGGSQNMANAEGSTVGGGTENEARGNYSTVSGGSKNKANFNNSTVGGGYLNIASSYYSTVSGGYENTASGDRSTVGGGWNATASGKFSTVGGGTYNTASSESSTVGGGAYNQATGLYSTVSGGWQNKAETFGEFLGGLWSTIKEGSTNTWIATDRIFGIGNGKSESERSDAFNVYKNGVAELPSVTNSLIDAAGPKTIPTKEWVENNQKLTQDELGGIQNANNLNAANPAATMADIPSGGGLQLGETDTTAYRGDRGKIAYDHSQEVTGNPHNVNASDVGLGNVDDTSDLDKPISTATQNALDEKVNSKTTNEPTGSDKVINMVSLTQAEYDAGTPNPTTFYIITDA